MSIQAVAWVLEQEDIPARPKLVLVAIANHANHVDGYCWLNAETIAREGACKRRSVYNFVGALIRNGYIRKALRKGDDGKQRSTDYWILFDREEKPWHQDAALDADEAEGEANESGSSEAETPDVVEPDARHATGKIDLPDAHHDTRQPVDIPAGASGPAATACHRKRIAEPSKTNPKEERAGARTFGSYRPRGYAPPPPQPLGAVVEQPKQQIFVYEGSRAWEAWVKHIKATEGRSWSLTSTAFIEGKHRTGWWFPTLFPPRTSGGAEPDPLTDADARAFTDTG